MISANDGANLWVGNNPFADGELHPMDTPEGAYVLRKNMQLDSLDDVSRDNVMRAEAFQFIIENPLQTLELFAKKVFYHWWFREGVGEQRGRTFEHFQMAYKLLYIGIFGFSFWGMFILYRSHRRQEVSLIAIVFLYSTLVSGLFFTQTRHRMIKDEPLMLMLDAIAIGSFWKKDQITRSTALIGLKKLDS